MENRGIEDPPSQLNEKFHQLFFFETVPNYFYDTDGVDDKSDGVDDKGDGVDNKCSH